MIRWREELELGIKSIDEQHKMLMQILDDLYDACSRGEGLVYIKQVTFFLEWYVIKHFKDEEKIQRTYKYPAFKEHVQSHQAYKDEIKILAKEVRESSATSEHIAKVVAYLNKMITDHMQGDDRKLAHYIKHHKLYTQHETKKIYEVDELTGLMNKKAFQDFMRQKHIEKATGETYCFLQIDYYNDVQRTYGYDISDEVLIFVSGVLREYEAEDCLIAHIYKNEFILCLEMKSQELRQDILEKIRKKIYDGFKRKGSIIPLSVSIGSAINENSDNLKLVFQHAEIALGVAKRQGGNQVIHYNQKMYEDITQKAAIINMLQPHSLQDYLKVVYQPIWDLKTKTIKGCEALLRMEDEQGKMISPVVFIPLAEANNLISDVGYFCMEEVCKDFAELKEALGDLQYVSVNLSVHQFKNADLVEKLYAIGKKYEVALENIYFELTESAFIEDMDQVKKGLEELRSYNTKILLDDFGSGYSALAYLPQMTIDIIKIDKHFLKDIGKNPKVVSVVGHMINLIHELGLTTVIEGVEQACELEKLEMLKADCIQGYYISKPASKEEICHKFKK